MRLTSALPGVGDWTQPEEDAPERVIWKKTEDQEGEENAALSHRLNKCRFGSALTVIRRNSVKMPDGTPGMALSSPIGGRYVVGAGMSFDVQLAELSDPQAARGMLDDLPLAANEPYIASAKRLHQLVAANAAIEIMVPANHPAFIDQVRPRMSATFTGPMESGFAIPYVLKTGGRFVRTPLHHTELIRLQPLGGQMTLEGDSGCAVVCWLDDNNCTLLGMFIAGDDEFSYAIPAWQLFNKKNYFGSLDGVTSIRPVRA